MNGIIRWLVRIIRWIVKSNGSYLTTSQRTTHTYLLGQPNAGKSRTLESWIMQDINAGSGLAVIDPHGELIQDLYYRISLNPKTWRRVIILDPCDPKWSMGFNPLAAVEGYSKERLALFLTDIVVKIWGLTPSSAPRLIWLLSNCFLALIDLDLTLLDLPRFLRDANYRNSLLPQLQNEGAREYFQLEFPTKQSSVNQWTAPLLNKIGALIFDPDIRLMFSSGSTINFREVMDRKQILLVNLPKGIIGEGASALLGAFIVAHIQKAALSRADSRNRTPFYLYLDEFQNYTTDNIKDILAESRKYALSLTLAHQYLDQLSPDLRSAVLNTSGTIASFRVGFQDARHMVREIFPSPDFQTTSEGRFKLDRFGSLPLLTFDENESPMGWDGLTRLLTELRPREFWVKRRSSSKPTKLRSVDMPDPIYTPEVLANMAKLLDSSGSRYGRLKSSAQTSMDEPNQTISVSGEGEDRTETAIDGDEHEYGTSSRKPRIREKTKAPDNQTGDEGEIIGL